MNRKWLASSILLFAVISGCDEGSFRLPTAPSAAPPTIPASTEVWLRGHVYDTDNHCLDQAAVVMLAGRNAGASEKTGCSYLIKNLIENDVVVLRATAPGHVAKEVQLTLVPDMDGWVDYDFRLVKE